MHTVKDTAETTDRSAAPSDRVILRSWIGPDQGGSTAMRLKRAAASVITATLLIGLAGCGDDDPKNGTEPTPTDPTSSTETTDPSPTAPTTTEPVTDEDKAADALLGYLQVRDEARLTGRVGKKLNKYATGVAHFALQQQTREQNDAGIKYEGEWVHEIVKTKADSPELILVTDCEDRSGVTQILSNGTRNPATKQFVDENGNPLPNPLRWSYRLSLDNGQWKVESEATNPNTAKSC